MSTIVKAIRIDVDASSIEEAEIAFGGVTEEVKDLQSELMKLDQAKNQATSPEEVARLESEYESLAKELDKVAKEYNDVAKAEKNATDESEDLIKSQQETAESAFKVGEGLVGAFTLVSLASADSQEDVDALLADMLQLVVVLDSVKKVSEGLANGFKLAQKASKSFGVGTKRAIAATGIGLLVVAIGSIAVALNSIEEEGKDSFGGLADTIDIVTAAFNTVKRIAIENFKLVGLAIAPVIAPLIILVRTIQNIKGAFDEGKTGLDAFGAGIGKTINEAKVLVGELVDDLKNVDKVFEEETLKQQLKRVVDALREQVKLTNGLTASNNTLLQAQKAVAKGAEQADKIQQKINANKRSAIFQEINLLNKTAELNGKLTSEELIRKQELNNQLAILRIEESQAEIEAQDKRFEAKQDAIQKELELRTATLTATITDADLLNKELLQVEEEALSKRVELNKEFGKELTQEAQLTALELQQIRNQSAQVQLDEDQKVRDEIKARQDEDLADAEKDLQNALNGQNSAIAEQQRDLRKQRNAGLISEEEFAKKSEEIEAQNLATKIQLRKNFGKETFDLESQLLDLERGIREKEEEEWEEGLLRRIQQFKDVALIIADIAFNIQETQIANIDQLIEDAQGRIDLLQTNIDSTRTQKDQLDSDIQASEENARKANGANADEIREQLNAQRIQRVKLIALEKKQQKEREQAEKEQAKLEEQKIAKEKQLAKQRANIAIATAIVQSAPAVANALSAPFPLSILAVATTLATLGGAISAAKAESSKLRKGGLLKGASHDNGGIKGTGSFGNIEVEGNEFVINKEATANNIGLIESINKYGATKKFASGGLIPNANATSTAQGSSEVSDIARSVQALATRPMVVGVTDIVSGIDRIGTIDDSSQIG